MNILFLDLSTKSTGYCIANDQQQILKYGCITASSTNNLTRIRKVQSEIVQLIKDYNIEKQSQKMFIQKNMDMLLHPDYYYGFKVRLCLALMK